MIPEVEFTPGVAADALVEILELDKLYARSKLLDHSLAQPHRMGFSMAIYIRQGEGEHFVDFNRWPYKSGSLIIINKNQVNAFDLRDKPLGKAILFSEHLVEKLQVNMNMPVFSPDYLRQDYEPVFQVSPRLARSCERLLDEIHHETRSGDPNSLITMFVFSALFLMIERERAAQGRQRLSSEEQARFAQFISLLEARFTQTRNASDYASDLHLTYKGLNSLCKKATDQTAKQLIDAYTILEAKRRLVAEGKRVQELAYDLGFDEVTNFTKYFRKHTKLPPSHFQRNARL